MELLGMDPVFASATDISLLLRLRQDPTDQVAWGNFVQTYSMVGLINSAIRLSMPWGDAF